MTVASNGLVNERISEQKQNNWLEYSRIDDLLQEGMAQPDAIPIGTGADGELKLRFLVGWPALSEGSKART